MRAKYGDRLQIETVETWHSPVNARVLEKFARGLGIEQPVVPLTLIGEFVVYGYRDGDDKKIEHAIRYELGLERTAPGEAATFTPEEIERALPILAISLGFTAGINPCSLYVLLFLLSFMVHAGSRGRILVAGGSYVFYSALLYVLFISAVLDLFVVSGRVSTLTTGAGILSVVLGLLNAKDFFSPGKFGSVGLTKGAKERIMDRLRRTARMPSMFGILAGSAVLAFFANIYAFLCTAGIPLAFTSVLAERGVPKAEYNLYIAMFSGAYVTPLALVVLIFAFSLGSRKLTEDQGRVLKLIAGVMMLTVGGVLLIRPVLFSDPVWALVMMGGAIGVSLFIARIMRVAKETV
jgi:hypothetical protein